MTKKSGKSGKSAKARKQGQGKKIWIDLNTGEAPKNSWLAAINRCRPYNAQDSAEIPLLKSNSDVATVAMIKVNDAFHNLKNGETPTDNVYNFELLSHFIGVAIIRTHEIAGPDDTHWLPTLKLAEKALARCSDRHQRWGKWELEPIAQQEIQAALPIYETILTHSSPAQMESAKASRMKILQNQLNQLRKTAMQTRCSVAATHTKMVVG
jgi:hypothetical protein